MKVKEDACIMCAWSPTTKPKAEYHFTLHIEGLSRNQIGSNNKRKWNIYRDWRDRCMFQVKKIVGIPLATGPRYGILTRHWAKRKREYDHDNWVGGCKPLVDTLVKAGLLVDDTPKMWRGYYRQEKSETGHDYISVQLMED